MYLDTNRDVMTVWPIYAFPYRDIDVRAVDIGQLKAITDNHPGDSRDAVSADHAARSRARSPPSRSPCPALLQQNNPYTADVATTADAEPHGQQFDRHGVAGASVAGCALTNLSPGFIANTSSPEHRGAAKHRNCLTDQQAVGRSGRHQEPCPCSRSDPGARCRGGRGPQRPSPRRQYQTDLWLLGLQPGHRRGLHRRTGRHRSDDPGSACRTRPKRHLRSVLCACRFPQYADLLQHVHHRAVDGARSVRPLRPRTTRTRTCSARPTNCGLGYMYSLYDGTNNFDSLSFSPWPPPAIAGGGSSNTDCLFTNLPYSTQQKRQLQSDQPVRAIFRSGADWRPAFHGLP